MPPHNNGDKRGTNIRKDRPRACCGVEQKHNKPYLHQANAHHNRLVRRGRLPRECFGKVQRIGQIAVVTTPNVKEWTMAHQAIVAPKLLAITKAIPHPNHTEIRPKTMVCQRPRAFKDTSVTPTGPA